MKVMNPQAVFEIEIEASPERIWAELFKTDVPLSFYYGTVLEIDGSPGYRIGSDLRYKNHETGEVIIVGKILEIDEPNRLVHSFKFTDEKDVATRAEWRLERKGKAMATRVRILHTDFEGETETYKTVIGGWMTILEGLKEFVED